MKGLRAYVPLRGRWLRLTLGLVGAAALVVAIMGFAHTPAGRPLLAGLGRIFGDAACPLGYDKLASPAERENARRRFAASHRGASPANNRPALGFELDRTLRSEVVAFMASRRVACQAGTSVADLVCEKVSASALPVHDMVAASDGDWPLRTLWFNFGPSDRLVSVVALSRNPRAEPISAALTSTIGVLARQAGPATRIQGDVAAASLAGGALRQASAEFRFSNYYATTRATNLGDNFLLTEEYRSLLN